MDDEPLASDDYVGDRIGFFVVLGLALLATWWLADGWLPALGTLAATLAGVVGLGLALHAVRGAYRDGIDLSDVRWGAVAAVLLALGAFYAPLELAAAAGAVVLVWLVDRFRGRLPEPWRRRRVRARVESGELEHRDVERRDAVDPHVPPL